MTKTLVDIDDDLMAEALRVADTPYKKQAVTQALQQMVRRSHALDYIDSLARGLAVDLADPEVVDQAQR